MIGRTLGPYTVLAKLGAGEMGEVYALNHPNLVTIHAVERLRPGRGASPRDAEHVASGGGVPASGENTETTHSSRWNWSKAGRSPRSFHAAA
jgi:hypothetical protein